MSRFHSVPDCFDVLTNNKRMTRSEIRGFQSDFNVNLSDSEDQEDWFDAEFIEEIDMTEISDEEFLAQCMGDDLVDAEGYTDWSMRQGEMGR